AMPRATSPLTALRACGLSIVMTATLSATSVRMASAIAVPPDPRGAGGCGGEWLRRTGAAPELWPGLLGLEADTAVEPDHFGVHVVIVDQRPDELRELGRRAHALGEHHRSDQLGLELIACRPGTVDRRVDDAWTDGVDPYPDRAEVPRGGDGHPDNAALGRRVGDLTGLTLDPGDRSGVDNHSALTIGVGRLGLSHRGRGNAHDVKRADQIDVDDLTVDAQIVRRPIPADGASRPADASAAHRDPQRGTECLRRGDRLGD